MAFHTFKLEEQFHCDQDGQNKSTASVLNTRRLNLCLHPKKRRQQFIPLFFLGQREEKRIPYGQSRPKWPEFRPRFLFLSFWDPRMKGFPFFAPRVLIRSNPRAFLYVCRQRYLWRIQNLALWSLGVRASVYMRVGPIVRERWLRLAYV